MNEVREAQGAGRRLPGWFGYIAAILIEGLVTGVLLLIQSHLPLGRFPIPYVLAIGVVAYVFGEGPAVLAFLIGIVAFDYFFNPPGTFRLADSRNTLGLGRVDCIRNRYFISRRRHGPDSLVATSYAHGTFAGGA